MSTGWRGCPCGDFFCVMCFAGEMDWSRLFPLAEHRFQMHLRTGQAEGFWGQQDATGGLLAERKRWVEAEVERYVLVGAGGEAVLEEALTWMAGAAGVVGGLASAVEAAQRLEPDWVVLTGGAGFPVLGGAVVFPSSWALEEKMGQPLAMVHGPVPGLQAELGGAIHTFLERLKVGASWERLNWGLSGDDELNHHPCRGPRGLGERVALTAAWLRLERQYLTRLERTGAVLFGIRVSVHRLDELARVPGVAEGLACALETMTPEVAAYKGVAKQRAELSAALRGEWLGAGNR